MGYGWFRRFSSKVAVFVCAAMVLSLAAPLFAQDAEAATSRVAKVTSVSGDVQVTKAGGSKPYKAFKNLYLNQGDHIKTGADSSLVVEVEDRKDEVTVGPNSELYVSQLKEEDGSKNTSFKVWSGTMWTKASKLVDTKDSFEIETPTAVMGVRGTNFMTWVDPRGDVSQVFVASGIVQAQLPAGKNVRDITGDRPSNAPVLVYPSQQANLIGSDAENSVEIGVTYADASRFSNQNAVIIAAMLRNKEAIDQENQTFLENMQNGEVSKPQGLDEEEALNRYRQNVENALFGLLNSAVESGLIDQRQLDEIIDQVNQETGQNLELDHNAKLQMSEEERRKQEAAKQAVIRKQQERQQQEAEQAKSKATLLQQVQQQLQKQNERNELAQQQKSQDAVDRYLANLSEQERQQFLDRANGLFETKTPAPTPTPPSSGSGGGSGPSYDSGTLFATAEEHFGNIHLNLTGNHSQTYGPASETPKQINGNVTFSGSATNEIALKNVTINGNFTVNLPNGTMKLDSDVTVNDRTIVQDVKAGTFESQASHAGIIDVRDGNGTSIRLGGHASSAHVEITGGGAITLHGVYSNEVKVKAANASLTIAEDAVVAGLDIQAEGVALTNNGIVESVRSSTGIALTGALEQAALQAINGAATKEQLALVLAKSGLTASAYQSSVLFEHLPFASLAQLRELLASIPEESPVDPEVPASSPKVKYMGSSPTTSVSLNVYTEDADRIYVVHEYAFDPYLGIHMDTITIDQLDELSAEGYDAFRVEVGTEQELTTIDVSNFVFSDEMIYLYAANGDVLSRASLPIRIVDSHMDGKYAGMLTLPGPAPEGGLDIMVFAKSAYESNSALPIEDEQTNYSIENYTFISIPENAASAPFEIMANYEDQIVGYQILTAMPPDYAWLKQGYVKTDVDGNDSIVAVTDGAMPQPRDREDIEIVVPDGRFLSGTIELDSEYGAASREVYVLAMTNDPYQAGYTIVEATPGGVTPFKVAVPDMQSYSFSFFVKEEAELGKVLYYKEESGYTYQSDDADYLISVNEQPILVIPGNALVGLEVNEVAIDGFRVDFEEMSNAYFYEFALFQNGEKFYVNFNETEAAENRFRGYVDAMMTQWEQSVYLEPNQSYQFVVTAVDEAYQILGISVVNFDTDGTLTKRPNVQNATPAFNARAVPVDGVFRFQFGESVYLEDNAKEHVTLFDHLGEEVEGVELNLSIENGNTLIVTLDTTLEMDTFYTIEVDRNTVWTSQGVSNVPFEYGFKTKAANLSVESVTTAVYENAVELSWASFEGANHYRIFLDGSAEYHTATSNHYVLDFEGVPSGEHVILIQAFDESSLLLAETEVYTNLPPLYVYDAEACFCDGIILFFSWMPVEGAAKYVIYNDNPYWYQEGPVSYEEEIAEEHYQVNYPGIVTIIAVDDSGRILAASEVDYIVAGTEF